RALDAPLTAIARAWGRWYVGVGHRVIRLGETFANDAEFAIPAGRVEAILEAAPAFWAPDDPDLDGADGRYERADSPQGRNPDVDGDGIPDALDPWPLRPAARATDLSRDRLTVRDARGGDALLLMG